MSESPNNLKYLASHEWIRLDEDGTVTVGISDHAQDLLGDIVFIELPEVGQRLGAEEEVAIVESVKAASDVYSPIGGKVIAINDKLLNEPDAVNNSPYEEGWFFKMEPDDIQSIEGLLSSEEYVNSRKN
ncbi:MAG: glycine cleavage system protein GcvH [SAR86 cluster bacterium]|jgi:glycine cleavage system H protein|nr:glycine cleavage system protein GcvH [SAR86 cluster bacterium]